MTGPTLHNPHNFPNIPVEHTPSPQLTHSFILRNPLHFGGLERFQGYVGVLVVDWDCESVYTINLDFQKNAIEPGKMGKNREGGDEGMKTILT